MAIKTPCRMRLKISVAMVGTAPMERDLVGAVPCLQAELARIVV